MNREEFERLLDELDGNSVSTLKEKNARYSSPDDTLHNFTSGADIMGGTPAQACWGYLTKHLVALRDMVERNDFHNREDFLEKCQDSINYIRFLWCLGNEERKNYVHAVEDDSKVNNSDSAEFLFHDEDSKDTFLKAMHDLFAREGYLTIANLREYFGLPINPEQSRLGWTLEHPYLYRSYREGSNYVVQFESSTRIFN